MLTNTESIKHEKKVCIIVPVYNAEKYLGYCLNSIISQTYTNWQAILVNDGSTDASLEICERYAGIDTRFKVLSKENGGVSSARNNGLLQADGDFLAFLDSDDCLAPDALERQVNIAEKYQSPLVMMDIMQVDFSNPSLGKNMLSSAWLKKSPCVLSAKEFREKKMQLVWYTVLLECLHAKLYDLKLWKKLNLSFPEDLSLGEDFLTNMKYFDACENVVFLRECGHYYNCIMGSNSLTQKYRPDLFENKMFLNEKLAEHLGDIQKLSKAEKDSFYCYVASNGLSCIEKLVLDSGLKQDKMIERMKQMLSNTMFMDSLQNASYIPERFNLCLEYLVTQKCENVIQCITNKEFKEKMTISIEKENEPQFSFINRAIRKILREMKRIFRKGRMNERLSRWEKEIFQYGLRYTLKKHVHDHKKVTNNQLERQIKLLEEQNARISQEYSNLLKEVDYKFQAELKEIKERVTAETTRIEEKVAAETAKIEEKVAAEATRVDSNVNGYIWYSEQRQLEYERRKEINELRQKKKVIMLATAEHANIGDSAITMAEQQLLNEQFSDYYQVEISTYEFEKMEEYLHAILTPVDIIFINGGGNMGDLYIEEEELHRKIISEFPNNKIVVFPQTISFSNSEKGLLETEKSAKIYNAHQDLTLFVRGELSFNFAKKYFNNAQIIMLPDMVHVLRTNYSFERRGILLCLRDDKEGNLGQKEKTKILDIMKENSETIGQSNNIYSEDVPREIRAIVVRKELMKFSKYQVVVTDRLHGMIFSAITGTPCVVLSSYNHKILEYYNTFFRDSNAVFFVGDDIENLDRTVKLAMQIKGTTYPIFEKNPHTKFRDYLEI